MEEQEMHSVETILEMIDLVRDGFFCDMSIICKGGTIETNSVLFSTLFPFVGRILENTRAYDDTYVLLIPEIDSNHLVEFLMTVMLKSSIVKAHQSIVNLLKPNFRNPTGKSYQENIRESEEPSTSVCIKFVDPKREISPQSLGDDEAEHIKNEELDDLLDDLDPMDTSDNVDSMDSPVQQEESKEFGCSLCGTFFKSKQYLKGHVLICKIPFKCDVCGSGFKSEWRLKMHIKDLHKEKLPFKCSECGSGFKYERALVRHYKEDHAITKPHKCKYCGKLFKKKFCLTNHQVIHEDKQFKCEYCDKLFNYLGNLKTHITRMHEEITQELICQECGKTFKEKSYLKMHQLCAHLKVKNIQCSFEGCSEKFVYTRHRYIHEEKVHGIHGKIKKTFKCRFECDDNTEYKDLRQRNKHEVANHGRRGKRKN